MSTQETPRPLEDRGLPEMLFGVLPSTGEPILIMRGESGYNLISDELKAEVGGEVRELTSEMVDLFNRTRGYTVAHREAMEFGSMFGWDSPAADSAYWQTTDAVLRRAAMLVRKGWEQGASARDSDGEIVHPLNCTASSWCASGAIYRAAWDLCGDEYDIRGVPCGAAMKIHPAHHVLSKWVDEDLVRGITQWNDDEPDVSAEDIADGLIAAANSLAAG